MSGQQKFDLSTVPTLDLAEEIWNRFNRARDNSAAVVAYSSWEDGGQAFYRIGYGGSIVAAFGLTHALCDGLREKMLGNLEEDSQGEEDCAK